MGIQSSDVILRVVILADCRDPPPSFVCLSVCLLCLAWLGLVSRVIEGGCLPPFWPPGFAFFFGALLLLLVLPRIYGPSLSPPVHWCFQLAIHSDTLGFVHICLYFAAVLKRGKSGVFVLFFRTFFA